MDRFAGALSVRREGDRLSFPITFLGLFDTVKGTGIIGSDITWPYTNKLPNVETIRHAVSIDETRRPFAQCLVPPVPPPGAQEPVVAEAWFAGIHSDVGGGVDNNPGLGNVSMRWVLDAAIDAGLIVHARRYKRRYTLQEADARQPKHRNGW